MLSRVPDLRSPALFVAVTILLIVQSGESRAFGQQPQNDSSPAVERLYEEAKSAQAAGDLEGAAAKYEAILKIAPRLASAYNNLGLLYFQRRDFAKAAAVLEKGLKVDPKMPSASALLGMSLYEMADYSGARPRLEAAVRANPQDSHAEMFLARDLMKLEDFDAAAARLQHLARTEPDNQEVWYLLGKVHIRLSENAIAKMNSIDPNSALAHEMSGEIMESMKNYDGALIEYKKAVDLAPHRAGTQYALGNAYWHIGQWEKATEHFRAELQNDPNNCMAQWKLGNIILEQNLASEDALQDTELALKTCPNLVQARVDRARALLKLNRSQDALPDLQIAVKANPEEPTIHFLLAQAYRSLGRVPESKAEMQVFSKLEESARDATAQRAREVVKEKSQ